MTITYLVSRTLFNIPLWRNETKTYDKIILNKHSFEVVRQKNCSSSIAQFREITHPELHFTLSW